VIKDASDPTAANDDEQFDSDFTLMTGEIAKLLDGVLDALGGELDDGIGAVKAA
jgi:recombination associated protein RdgC